MADLIPDIQVPDLVAAPIEAFQDAAGISRVSPQVRGLATGAATAGIIWAMKPEMFFDGEEPKPWSFTSTASNAVSVPWWGPGVLFGFLNLAV